MVIFLIKHFQDLLKNIHSAAAKFYDERKLLVNATKRYRKERKLRKLGSGGMSVEVMPEGTPDSQSLETTDTESAIAMGGEHHRKVNRDMYKVLDGSVLVAMGMSPPIPV